MSSPKHFVISIYSPIGGQGVSLISSQLVHLLSKHGSSCLLDLNLDLSIGLHYLGKDPQTEFRHSALASDEESTKLSTFAISIDTNYYALGMPLLGYGQFAEDLHEAMKELFDQCKSEFTYTVIDMPHPFHVELSKKALEMSDLILLLTGDTEFAGDSAIKLKQLISQTNLKSMEQKVHVVLNNCSSSNFKQTFILHLVALLILGLIMISQKTILENNPAAFGLCALATLSQLAYALIHLKHKVLSSRHASKKLKEKQIPIFHELPNDTKTCRWAISQRKFFPEHTLIANSLKTLCEKVRTKLDSGKI